MNDEQLLRYSRHILLDEIGIEAQERLLASTMLIVGAGGLGSPAALYLAAAGVGRLMIADGDTVDLTNLQRQILHRQDRIGMDKTGSAKLTLQALNPDVELCLLPRLDLDTTHRASCPTTAGAAAPSAADARETTAPHLRTARASDPDASNSPPAYMEASIVLPQSPQSLSEAIRQADVVLDCSDNFPTRQAINRGCILHRKPLVSGAAIRFDGQLSIFDPRQDDSPCYHCLFPEGENVEETRCSQMGVFAPLTGIIGTMQAAEALKLAGRFGTSITGQLLLLDARTMRFTPIRVPRDPDCPVCRDRISAPTA
ncbi:MAG: ThiF family adenylyltransferase [Lautropia sp.]|nr:ThiF family adenylyltransferase [Lautropia sp.]